MIGVIGAGAMGGALAVQLARAGNPVTILATEYDRGIVEAHQRGEAHPAIGVRLPEDATFVAADGWADVLPKMDMLVLAVSTAGLVPVVRACAAHTSPEVLWAIATKGWDEDTLRSAATVVIEELGDASRAVVVVGPSIAREIAQKVPTAVVCASADAGSARRVAELFASDRFRTYISDDVAGVEVGAALKNVIAIGIGMCDGLAETFGVEAMTNAKAFLFSRGLVEMATLARALGGRAETVLGLAGAGDLFVTALAGRNGRFGRLVGSGKAPQEALDEMATTVEGYANVGAAVSLAQRHGIDAPVVMTINEVLAQRLSPAEGLQRIVAGRPVEEL